MALLLFALQKEPRGAEQELEEQKNYCGALCSALKKKTVNPGFAKTLQHRFLCLPRPTSCGEVENRKTRTRVARFLDEDSDRNGRTERSGICAVSHLFIERTSVNVVS